MTSKDNSNIAQYHLHKAHPEKLQFEVYDLNDYRKRSLTKAAVPHSHSYYQIIWFFQAGGRHTVDFNTHEILKDTILFINKDQVHCFDHNLEVQGWLIHFNEIFFMHSDVDIFLKYNIFDTQQKPCFTIDAETAKNASSHIALIQKELDKRLSFGHEEAVRFLLKSLLINLERIHRSGVEKKPPLNSQYELQFFRYKELIEQHYQNALSVNQYANRLNISSKTLTTITKSIVDKSPSQLIVERTILESKRLLKFTSFQIGEISFRVGFEDASYFIKYFKKHVGNSPKNYRNSLKG